MLLALRTLNYNLNNFSLACVLLKNSLDTSKKDIIAAYMSPLISLSIMTSLCHSHCSNHSRAVYYSGEYY